MTQQQEDEGRKKLQQLEDYAVYSDESERQEYLRENGYYGF